MRQEEDLSIFGYIAPYFPNLRVRDKTLYEAYYCGLCNRLGKLYGSASRASLNYDCVFMALLLESLSSELNQNCTPQRCKLNPLSRKKPMLANCASPALDYAAAICVLLAMHKIDDDRRDGKPLRVIAKPVLSAPFKSASRREPQTALLIRRHMQAIAEIEQRRDPSLETGANAFASMLKDIMRNSPVDDCFKAPLCELGFHLGRYIFFCDALDDLPDDIRAKRYNPFSGSDFSIERAKFLINFAVNSAIDAYDLLGISFNGELLDNIIKEGCFAKADAIFLKRNEVAK